MRRRTFKRGMWLVVLSTCLVLASMPGAGAAPSHKRFSTSITPVTTTAGTPTTFDLTITNTSSSASLGAAEITVPSAFVFEGQAALEAGTGWLIDISGHVIEISASDRAFSLEPGEAISVSIDTVSPLQESGDESYLFPVQARQANDFNGKQNDLNGTGPSVLVTGVAEPCQRGVSCTASFSEGGTQAEVTTTCPASAADCLNLVLDLDDDCLDRQCIGSAAFWLPPTTATGTVEVLLQIPKSQVPGGAGSVVFYIAGTDDEAAFECGSAQASVGCSYKVTGSKNMVQIRATVERVDPRGFVS
jgi:hypothetical protein